MAAANFQFQIPGEPERQPLLVRQPAATESPLQAALRIADSYQYTPEKQPEVYRFLLESAQRVHVQRFEAIEADRARKKTIRESLPWATRDTLSLDDVTNLTSEVAHGAGSGKRFWLANRHDFPSTNQGQDKEEVEHWLFEQKAWLANGRPASIVLHYEVRPSALVKWHNGVPYPPNLEETETFCKTALHYEKQSCEVLSPLDNRIHEFQEEMLEEEQIVARETNVAMFSKPALDRMRAYHQAQLQNQAQDDQTRFAA